MERSDTDSEYESGAAGPPTKKKLRTEIVHKKCVTTDSKQDLKSSETQSTDNESRRGLPLQIIGDIVIEHDNNQMEVDDGNLTIDHVQKPRQIIGVRLNKVPKTSAERGREFRARKALLKQQCKQQQEPDAIVEIATEDIQSAGPSEKNQVPEPSEITTIEKRAKSAEATRRWREKKKGVSESSKKQAKTAAQRMRDYRERKKLAKKILLEQQSDQDLDAIVSTSSSQVNQRAGPSTINSISAELTRIRNSQSQQQIEGSERTREYRERRNDNVNIELGKMNFLDNFDPETSARERRKLNRKSYFMNRKTKNIYDERGQIAVTGKDLCDCLDETCPGCHFACTNCNSGKCGHECRVNRKWMYDRIEIEGNDFVIKNEYKNK